jgi:ubiquitin-protein ligase
MTPRLRRLESDYKEILEAFTGSPYVYIEPQGLLPPEKYHVLYRVPALSRDNSNQIIVRNQTVIEINLPLGYPKEKPHAVSFDPIFHPNFGEYICIADFWSPANSLVDVIRDIGFMLQWQKYNIRSPLNAVAAEWSQTHLDAIPLGKIDFGMAPIQLNGFKEL